MPLFYNINTLMYRPCTNCLSFLLQTFPSPADSTFRDHQLLLIVCVCVCVFLLIVLLAMPTCGAFYALFLW